MNPAISAAIIAASQDKSSEEFIHGKLREANALGASGAIQLDLDDKQRKFLDQALANGTVIKTVDGRLYLNERAVSDRKEGQGFMALLIMLVAGSVLASIVILVSKAGG